MANYFPKKPGSYFIPFSLILVVNKAWNHTFICSKILVSLYSLFLLYSSFKSIKAWYRMLFLIFTATLKRMYIMNSSLHARKLKFKDMEFKNSKVDSHRCLKSSVSQWDICFSFFFLFLILFFNNLT